MSLYGPSSTSHAAFAVLPANENPYLALNGYYKSQLVFRAPPSAVAQLSYLSAIHAL
ncbi:hypothetical protein JCM10212_005314, partial [Sporobolomyces blumeae]